MKKVMASLAALTALAGCQTIGGPGVSSYFDCNNGTMLKVTYAKRGATVQVGGSAIPIFLRSVPSVGGTSFEGGGYNLRVMGDTATWSGPTREAPKTCSRVAVPR